MVVANHDGGLAAGQLAHQLGEELAGQHSAAGLLDLRREGGFNGQAAIGAGQGDAVIFGFHQHALQHGLGGTGCQGAGNGIQAFQKRLHVHDELHRIILSFT